MPIGAQPMVGYSQNLTKEANMHKSLCQQACYHASHALRWYMHFLSLLRILKCSIVERLRMFRA